MINKDPIYQQLNNELRELLTDDQFKVGDKFLTERMICDRYDVSRTTANKALSNLVSEGL
ncbi:MAG TPA: phosphonate metabolism transcriptional regulator PhnF, partial [Spirochaeta sp.]|nr:phosphonate metabolism transcriptional regulator PhnF [Spirochaeta sp.]